MTTIVDPLGSPAIFYNRSGTTIITVTAAGTTGSGATQFSALTETTIVVLTSSAGNTGAKLPPDSDTNVGDLVEIHATGPNAQIYDNSNAFVAAVNGSALSLRKIAANTWSVASAA